MEEYPDFPTADRRGFRLAKELLQPHREDRDVAGNVLYRYSGTGRDYKMSGRQAIGVGDPAMCHQRPDDS